MTVILLLLALAFELLGLFTLSALCFSASIYYFIWRVSRLKT